MLEFNPFNTHEHKQTELRAKRGKIKKSHKP